MFDYEELNRTNDPNVWVAFMIERCLDTDEGVNEQAFDAMNNLIEALPISASRDYIERMICSTRATDGHFYLKDDFPFLFGKDFLDKWNEGAKQ
ncbi:hypothetical protein H8D29_03540 [PVC group bacterium]|nr:hypothetical protein [PVC group bacterium]